MLPTLGLRRLHLLPAVCLAAGLSACMPAVEKPQTAKPVSMLRPRPIEDRPAPITKASAAAKTYYGEMQKKLLSQGLLRTDGGGEDTPFTDHMLAENFVRIALYDEYRRKDGRFTQANSISHLRRWQAPVKIEVVFGPSVAKSMQETDLARIKSYAQKLSQATGHPISVVPKDGNFVVHVVSEDERLELGPALLKTIPALSQSDVQDMTQMQRTNYCMVYAASQGQSGVYERAVAVVRAEHPDLLRQSCYHEEIAQGLGLANDSPYARPSIFNDDEEFALLTTMDEMMLKILYDQSLHPGMTEAEARPHVKRLASLLKG